MSHECHDVTILLQAGPAHGLSAPGRSAGAAGVLLSPPPGVAADGEQSQEAHKVLWGRAAPAAPLPEEPWLREVRLDIRGGQDRDAGAALPFRGKAGEARAATGAEDKDPAGGQATLQHGGPELQRLHPVNCYTITLQ